MSQKTDELAALLVELDKDRRLSDWTAYTQDLHVPGALLGAFLTVQPSLITQAPVEPASAEEVRILYNLIAGLLETNEALRTHARETAKLVDRWTAAFKHLGAVGLQIDHFANFRRIGAALDAD